MPSNEEIVRSRLNDSVDEFLSKKKRDKKENQHNIKFLNIIEFIDTFKLLPYGLYPVQKFILKMYYGIPLDTVLPEDETQRIRVPKAWDKLDEYSYMTEVEYLAHLYAQGRCNVQVQDLNHPRREIILVIGRRSGKCLREGSFIYTNRGVLRIEELGDPDGSEWQDLEIFISKESGSAGLTDGFYNPGVQDVIEINTDWGYQVCGTNSHRIKMIKSGLIDWKSLEDIEVGDWVGINRNSDLWASDYIKTDGLHGLSPLREMNWPQVLDERWGRLLGLLVGGCWTYRSQVMISGGDDGLLPSVKSLFDELFGYHTEKRKGSRGQNWSVHCYSRPLREFLHNLGFTIGSKPSEKQIPWSIFKSPKSVVSEFLSGLFEAYGGCEKKGTVISLCSASEKLIRQTQTLLLNYGILSRVSSKWNKIYNRQYWRLAIIGYSSRILFRDNIGFLSERKNFILNTGIDHGGYGHSSTESVPEIRFVLQQLVDSVNKSTNNRSGVSDWRRMNLRSACGNCLKPGSTDNPSYSRLRRIIGIAKELGADGDIIERLESILALNYGWTRVTSKTPGRARVFDISVPDGHDYVASGFTNHNSTLSSICSAYELYKLLRRGHPQSYYGMPDGSEIRILCIANDKEQAQIVYQEMSGYIGQVDYFKNSIIHDTLSYMKFQTENDKKIFGEAQFGKQGGKGTLTATFKSSVAKGLRGRGVICCTMDEIAFFEDVGSSSADEILRSISPSLRQFSPKDPRRKFVPLGPSEARLILISSPNAKEGFFYRRYLTAKSRDKASNNILMIQAPTWEVNPTLSAQDYDEEYYKGPAQFFTEMGAEFSDRVRGWIENHNDLIACINPEHRPLVRGIPREPFFAGIDFGLINDGTAIALTHLSRGKIELAYHEAWYAKQEWKIKNPHLEAPLLDYANHLERETRLDIEKLADWIEAICKRFYIVKGVFDQWAGPIFEQHLHKRGLTQFEMRKFTTNDSSDMYQTLKMAMFDRRVSLYDWPVPPLPTNSENAKKLYSPLITELLELQSTVVGKNIVSVEAPKIAGKHDDNSDAYARSVLLASEYISANPGALEATMTVVQNPLIGDRLRTGYHQFYRQRNRLHGGAPKERRSLRGRV